ncbi:unnamed protein product, partial [marine sediment metagenome]
MPIDANYKVAGVTHVLIASSRDHTLDLPCNRKRGSGTMIWRIGFIWLTVALASVILLTSSAAVAAEIVEKPIKNAAFEEGVNDDGIPNGWRRYAGKGEDLQLKVVEGGVDDGKALLIHDGDPAAEVGV